MSVVIFVSHGVSGSEGASSLVDLLEAGLQLSDGGIACSSLPGYDVPDVRVALQQAGAVIAWADAGSLADPRIAFELGLASGLGKWIVIVCDRDVGDLPWALGDATVVARNDTAALGSLVEDIAFQLDLAPRLGAETASAIRRVSQHPPAGPLSEHDRPTPRPAPAPTADTRPRTSSPPPLPPAATASDRSTPPPPPPTARRSPATQPSRPAPPPPQRSAPPPTPVSSRPPVSAGPAGATGDYEAVGTVPPPPFMVQGSSPASRPPSRPPSSPGQPSAVRAALARAASRPPSAPPAEQAAPGLLGCELAFDAGRALSEVIYHDESGEPSRAIDPTFGQFVDAIGGEWSALARLDDTDLWNGTMENLLEALPPEHQHLSQWYSMGFEFGLLINVATDSVPEGAEERSALLEVWSESTGRFRELAWACIGQEAAAAIESQLQDLLHERDYASVGRSLGALREYAQYADASA